ncbi:MAG: hypothetical protein EPN93_13820 [Spirochaetes bacterium]|nr:MAG: hypothetical protein EPN93_13820 [Spirochaetota bacterium]
MKEKDSEALFAREIRKRGESEAWSADIARAVLVRRRKRFVIEGASGVTGLAAAVLVVALAAGLFDSPAPMQNSVSGLIAAQVEGTYAEVFTRVQVAGKSESATTEDLGGYDSMDEMIDVTLAMR